MSIREYVYDWGGANHWLFHAINGMGNEAAIQTFQTLTKAGDHHNFPYYFGASALIVAAVLLKRKASGTLTSSHIRVWAGLLVVLLLSYTALAASVGMLKLFFSFPRPYIVFYGSPTPAILHSSLPEKDFYSSFPSGHSAFITLMVTCWWPLLPGLLRGAGLALIGAILWSRVAVGMHFPADVVGGALIGLTIALLVRHYTFRIIHLGAG